MQAKAHYDTHLAAFYSWMVGDFEQVKSRVLDYFLKHDIQPCSNGVAVDLGAGTGLQTVALAELGFRVEAVDFSAQLLSELRDRARGLPVKTHEGDLLRFQTFIQPGEQPELIVCMGDTLTHLDSVEDVSELFETCRLASLPSARLLLSFRPLTTELTDTQRFLPVRNDANRIHTCLLEYLPDSVRVTDLVHERAESGHWEQKVSSYYKLRLSGEDVTRRLALVGWQVISQAVQQGMLYLIAERDN